MPDYVDRHGLISHIGITDVRHQAECLKKAGAMDDAERYLCKYDLRYLCKHILGYQHWDVIHDRMFQFLWNSKKKRKLIMIPRHHLKSSIFTIGRSIQWMLQNFNIKILISNVKWGNSKNFLHQIKQYLTSGERLIELFGQFRDDEKARDGMVWNRESIIISQRDRPSPEPTIATCGVESEQTSQHYDVIIHDDIVARENISTPEQIEKVKNYYRDSASLLSPWGEMYVIGTPWCDSDLYVDLEKDEDFDIFKEPAYQRIDGKINVAFPKMFTYESLMKKKKEIGPYLFSAQYLLDPYPEEAQEFKKSWFRYYVNFPHGRYYTSMVLDPSLGKKTSNHAGLSVTSINEEGMKWIRLAMRFKRTIEQMPGMVVDYAEKYEVDVIGIERYGFQQTLYEPICAEVRRRNLKIGVEILPFVEADKNTRIQGLIPHFSSGGILMQAGMVDLIDELLKFNPMRKNQVDDIIDSLAWHITFWDRKPAKIQTTGFKEGTYGYLMNKMKGNKGKDIFYDFRKTSNEPVYLSPR